MTPCITRRSFVAGIGSAVVGARGAWGQGRIWRIALVSATSAVSEMTETGGDSAAAALRELRRLGFVEGQNVSIDRYSGGGQPERYASLAQEVVATAPDIIFNMTSTPIGQALGAATKTIPIVFVITDAIDSGFVTNLAHPGGNVTGAQNAAGRTVDSKRIGLLHEAVPAAKSLAVVIPRTSWDLGAGPVIRDAAAASGLSLLLILEDTVGDEVSYRQAFDRIGRERIELVLVGQSSRAAASYRLLAELCAGTRTAAISANLAFVEAGGLMYYGASTAEAYVRAARYIARILNGERPGDLPVQLPETYEFIVNLKSAKGLAINLPAALLAQATEIRE